MDSYYTCNCRIIFAYNNRLNTETTSSPTYFGERKHAVVVLQQELDKCVNTPGIYFTDDDSHII